MTDRERKCWESFKQGFAVGMKKSLVVGGVVLGGIAMLMVGSQIGALGTMTILKDGGIPEETLKTAWKAGTNAIE